MTRPPRLPCVQVDDLALARGGHFLDLPSWRGARSPAVSQRRLPAPRLCSSIRGRVPPAAPFQETACAWGPRGSHPETPFGLRPAGHSVQSARRPERTCRRASARAGCAGWDGTAQEGVPGCPGARVSAPRLPAGSPCPGRRWSGAQGGRALAVSHSRPGAGGSAALTSGPLSRVVAPLHLQCRPLLGPASCGLWFKEARTPGCVPR